MKTIPLTKGYVTVVDDEDYELAMRFSWCAEIHRLKDGSIRTVYAASHLPECDGVRKGVYLHRLLTDAPPDREVDHWDHDGLNNRRNNLRVCTATQNHWNGKRRPSNTSGYRGVSPFKCGKWRADIKVNGKQLYLGCFETPKEAALAYDCAAIKHCGEFASLNIPR